MMNKIIIQARFVDNPELKMTQTGVATATFRIACSRDYVPKGGERETDFFTVIAWRNTAEFIVKNFSKGDMALFYGRMQSRNFTDKEGNKRMAYEISLEEVQFCGKKSGEAEPAQQQASYSHQSSYSGNERTAQSTSFVQDDDEDIPF